MAYVISRFARKPPAKAYRAALKHQAVNSWGPDWADGGCFWLPAGYVTSRTLARDFWVIEQVE
ncbi:MAG TPA: hypothetical protein VJ716_00370 [Gaiellaceae bacterium]|nr:hypothetical protein [Gaiellaceae bacterium]